MKNKNKILIGLIIGIFVFFGTKSVTFGYFTVLPVRQGGTGLLYPTTGFQLGTCLTGNGLSAIGTTTCGSGGGGSGVGWATSTDAGNLESIYFTGLSNVGIGTSSPYSKLSVVGASGVVADKYFATSTTATSTFVGGLVVDTTTLVADYSTNRVGIGLTTPTEVLSVNGAISITGARSGSTGMVFSDEGSSKNIQSFNSEPIVINGQGNNVAIGNDSTPDFTMEIIGTFGVSTAAANDGNMFIVNSLNNVGVGTSSPYAKLSVVGETVARNFTATSTTATSTFNGSVISNDYYSSDGTRGFTGTCTILGITSIVVKNGLIVSCI